MKKIFLWWLIRYSERDTRLVSWIVVAPPRASQAKRSPSLHRRRRIVCKFWETTPPPSIERELNHQWRCTCLFFIWLKQFVVLPHSARFIFKNREINKHYRLVIWMFVGYPENTRKKKHDDFFSLSLIYTTRVIIIEDESIVEELRSQMDQIDHVAKAPDKIVVNYIYRGGGKKKSYCLIYIRYDISVFYYLYLRPAQWASHSIGRVVSRHIVYTEPLALQTHTTKWNGHSEIISQWHSSAAQVNLRVTSRFSSSSSRSNGRRRECCWHLAILFSSTSFLFFRSNKGTSENNALSILPIKRERDVIHSTDPPLIPICRRFISIFPPLLGWKNHRRRVKFWW